MLKLIEPDKKYLDQYLDAYEETLKEIKKGNISSHDMVFYNPREVDIIQKYMDSKDENKLPFGYVPSYSYFAIDEDKFIGVINIRVRLTPSLEKFGGHIGYGVNPKYWKMGYGTKILSLAISNYKNLIKEDIILITCDDTNIGSYKIIEANNGVLENKIINECNGEKFVTRRYWINK